MYCAAYTRWHAFWTRIPLFPLPWVIEPLAYSLCSSRCSCSLTCVLVSSLSGSLLVPPRLGFDGTRGSCRVRYLPVFAAVTRRRAHSSCREIRQQRSFFSSGFVTMLYLTTAIWEKMKRTLRDGFLQTGPAGCLENSKCAFKMCQNEQQWQLHRIIWISLQMF